MAGGLSFIGLAILTVVFAPLAWCFCWMLREARDEMVQLGLMADGLDTPPHIRSSDDVA